MLEMTHPGNTGVMKASAADGNNDSKKDIVPDYPGR